LVGPSRVWEPGNFSCRFAIIGDTFLLEKAGSAWLIGAVFGLAFIIGPLMGTAIANQLALALCH
jgi:hypothetical protein